MTIRGRGWFPLEGMVTVQAGPAISCAACGTVENAATKPNALRMRDRHRCPPGTQGAVPRCPVCGSTGPSCVLLGGIAAPMWHVERDDLAKAAR